jgi:hypothetical protein
MESAHHRAKSPNRKDDLVASWEGDFIQDIPAQKGSEHEGDREHDVAHACHMGAILGRNRFGKESVETNTHWREWNCHQECNGKNGADLCLFVQDLRQEDEWQIAGPIENGCPKDGGPRVLCLQPATGRQRQQEIDRRRQRAEQADLKTIAPMRGVNEKLMADPLRTPYQPMSK